MFTTYWSQWSCAEIMSMYGVELLDEEVDTDLEHEEDDTNVEKHWYGDCMDSLGLSWRDFM